MTITFKRAYPVGAEICKEGVHFRVFAPRHKKVELVIEQDKQPTLFLEMKKEKKGYFSLFTNQAKEGTLYYYRLSGSRKYYADPASRYQPLGPEGPSCVMKREFKWTDDAWAGVRPYNHIIYEMHIGTFTQEGSYAAAMQHIEYLADLGITLIELMPVNDFPGHFGWGYDGVNLYAPCHLYGTPNELKAFINKAHQYGIGVVLDVVYNHLGPEGNHLIEFAKEYLSDTYDTDWGQAINFDHPDSKEFFLSNARYWIEEFHFDGLRFDATPWLLSSSPVHILQEFTQTVRQAGGKKNTLCIGENEPQDTKLLRPYEEGGYGFDMLWNDDFHHTAHVRLTGKREAYYTDYLGSPQEFISSLKYGFLYQGQYYEWQKKPRGTPCFHIPHHAMVVFLENHDQLANSGYGARLHQKSEPGNYRALTALFLLSPNTPLIFQGQEFNSSKNFLYFADHSPLLSPLIRKGRKKELSQFPRLKIAETSKFLPSPENPLTFTQCKLDHREREKNAKCLLLYKHLITLKKKDPVFSAQNVKIDGAVLGTDAFLIRYFNKDHGDRLLIVNFGPDLYLKPSPEPLLAPDVDQEFRILWSSESYEYGGEGTPPINIPYWKILGHSVVVLESVCKNTKK